MFFGYSFNSKLSIKTENTGKKVVLPQINRRKALFSFQSCDWLYFVQSGNAFGKNNWSTGPNGQ